MKFGKRRIKSDGLSLLDKPTTKNSSSAKIEPLQEEEDYRGRRGRFVPAPDKCQRCNFNNATISCLHKKDYRLEFICCQCRAKDVYLRQIEVKGSNDY